MELHDLSSLQAHLNLTNLLLDKTLAKTKSPFGICETESPVGIRRGINVFAGKDALVQRDCFWLGFEIELALQSLHADLIPAQSQAA